MSQKLGEAALPHSHCHTCGGFPGPPLLGLSLLLVMGEQFLMEKQSPGLGNNPWDGGVIPGIRVVILEAVPWRAACPKWGKAGFLGPPSNERLPWAHAATPASGSQSCEHVQAFSGIAFSACMAGSMWLWPLAARWD